MANAPKIVFFDLDGTLLRSQEGHVAFNEAILKTFGVPGDIRTIRPDGKTDPIILQEIFDTGGHDVEWKPEDTAAFSANLKECYTRAITEGPTRVRALAGVPELVGELSRMPDLCLGVVTGNMEVTARLKLQAAGVGEHIGPGAFGSDSANRNDLPRIAMERWSAHLKVVVEPRDCVIVGDTPRDLEAARSNGMKCLLVATGRYNPLEELRKIEPDELLADFSDTRAAVEALMGLFG
ncbi:MAG: HAD family hydrolase [Deltaproteobacteria bacterium]|nr:HAD family hydrolase [Deltaproteobacteria bacterium]